MSQPHYIFSSPLATSLDVGGVTPIASTTTSSTLDSLALKASVPTTSLPSGIASKASTSATSLDVGGVTPNATTTSTLVGLVLEVGTLAASFAPVSIPASIT